MSTKLHALYDSSSELARLQKEYDTAMGQHLQLRYFHRMVMLTTIGRMDRIVHEHTATLLSNRDLWQRLGLVAGAP